MIQLIYTIFFMINMVAMDDLTTLKNRLQEIICTGTIEDFQQLEPDIRMHLDYAALEIAIHHHCGHRLEALEYAFQIQDSHIINELVTTAENHIASLSKLSKGDFATEQTLYFQDLKKAYKQHTSDVNQHTFKTAMGIIRTLFERENPINASLKDIRNRLIEQPNPHEYINHEDAKLRFIIKSIQQIEHDEFECFQIDIDAKHGVYGFIHQRKKRERDIV